MLSCNRCPPCGLSRAPLHGLLTRTCGWNSEEVPFLRLKDEGPWGQSPSQEPGGGGKTEVGLWLKTPMGIQVAKSRSDHSGSKQGSPAGPTPQGCHSSPPPVTPAKQGAAKALRRHNRHALRQPPPASPYPVPLPGIYPAPLHMMGRLQSVRRGGLGLPQPPPRARGSGTESCDGAGGRRAGRKEETGGGTDGE